MRATAALGPGATEANWTRVEMRLDVELHGSAALGAEICLDIPEAPG